MDRTRVTRSAQLLAAGTVLWRPAGHDGLELALVHRPRYDDWSLPKGKVDPGEPLARTAVRETREETGHTAVLQHSLGSTSYDVALGRKQVHYWAARAGAGEFAADREVDRLAWLPPAAALERLTHPHDRTPVQRLLDGPRDTTTVLLVRHARAGDRAGWSGPDRDRPLEARGVVQAGQLADLLACWAPRRVLSADRTRCVQTLEPLAQEVGVPVETDPSWTDEATGEDLGRTLARARALGTTGTAVAVCSQGGAIPAVVAALAAADGVVVPLRRGRPPARKASTWALSFHGARLVAADHLPDPGPVLPV